MRRDFEQVKAGGAGAGVDLSLPMGGQMPGEHAKSLAFRAFGEAPRIP
jgi:hypothetical protein